MFDRRLRFLEVKHSMTMVLPFLLADEGLTAEEIEFVIEKFLNYPIDLNRLKLLFDSEESKLRRWKVDDLPLEVLKEIKRLREEEGYGYHKITRLIFRKFKTYVSPMTIRRLLLDDLDELIREKEKEENKLNEIAKKIDEEGVEKLSLKELVWFAMRREDERVNREIERRVRKMEEKSEELTVFDVL